MTPTMVRNSERSDWRRCRKRWEWTWVDGLKARRVKTPLWLGQGVHEALAEFYRYKGSKRRGPHPAETFQAWAGDSQRQAWTRSLLFDEDERVSATDLAVAMLEGYIDRYGRDDRVQVIAAEDSFELGIPHPKHPSITACIYCGTFDLVYRDLATGEIWLMEHKTRKAIKTSHLAIDQQASGYWLAATSVLRHKGLIKPTDKLEGIKYNFLRKAFADDRPTDELGRSLNKDGSVSKSQPTPLFHREPVYRTPRELRSTALQIVLENWEMNQVRAGKLPVYKNQTEDCDWQCPFYEMCDLHEKGDDWETFRDEMYQVVDPYEDHRPKTTEE